MLLVWFGLGMIMYSVMNIKEMIVALILMTFTSSKNDRLKSVYVF